MSARPYGLRAADDSPARGEEAGVRSDGPSTRAILRVIAVVGAIALLAWLLWVSRGVVTWVAIGAFLAVAINPAVRWLHLRLRLRLRRAAAILLVYLMPAGLVAGAALLFVPPLVNAGRQALVSIAVICFLLSLNGPRLRAWTLSQLEGERHDRVERVCDRVYRVVSGYVNLLGVIGALLAIPVAGVVQVLVQEWWSMRRGTAPVEAGP